VNKFLRHITTTAARGGALTSLTVWGWSAPFLIVGLLFTELASITTLSDIGWILASGVVSHAVLGLTVVLARVTVLTPQSQENAGPLLVLGFLVFAGAARGVALIWLKEAIPPGNDVAWWLRLFTSIFLITVSFLYTSYSVQLWRDYVARRRELLAAIATNETALGRQEIATSAYRELVFKGVEDDIQVAKKQTEQAIDTIAERIEGGGISAEELDTLFGESDRAWREASHRAWEATNPDIPRVTARELAITLLGSKPVALTVFFLSAIFGLLRILGPEIGIIPAIPVVIATLVGQVTIGLAINAVSRFGPPWNQMTFGAGVLVLLVWPVVLGLWSGFSPMVILTITWLGAVTVFFSLFLGLPVALAQSGESVLARLEERVDESAISQLRTQGEMFVLAQKIGAYLHGPLRSQFLQLSMELRASLETADPFQVASSLAKLREVANGLDQQVDSASDLKQFLDNWRALIEVETNLDEVHIPERIGHAVATVVTEAVNNAIRHGSATRVGVFFRYRPEGLLVEVIGAPADSLGDGEAGLGAEILNDIAPGMWLYDVTEDGRYRLRVTMKTTD
jgi:hypothetical protein